MQSVELLLDETLDRHVRHEWEVLDRAGLPSPARIDSESVRPHVTLAVADAIDPVVEPTLRAAAQVLPVPLAVAGFACFAQSRGRAYRFVLVRLLAGSAELLALQEQVAAEVGVTDRFVATMTPGRWVPHITLARNLGAEQVAQALDLLAGSRPRHGSAVAMRRWDGGRKREWLL